MRSSVAFSSSWLPLHRRLPTSPSTCIPHRGLLTCSLPALEITSLQNPRVKVARTLLRRRGRETSSALLTEGHRLVLDAAATHVPQSLFYTGASLTARHGGALAALVARVPDATLVSDAVLASLCDTSTPQGVVAVFRRPDCVMSPGAELVLICDRVGDPGNVGTLVRAAAGAGADAVVLSPGCADAWGPKALRAGMGSQMRVPVLGWSWEETGAFLKERGFRVCVADGESAEGGGEIVRKEAVGYAGVDWTQKNALIIGSEADGPGEEAHALADCRVSIPLASGTESLNAAVAGAVILFEASRQRAAAQVG